jgi:predicted enzyme related to lactoylglutathione lyase
MRENMAAMGAPERFEDVVASILPIADDQPDVPAHWGVTFGVDDADAIAARATELGGKVVVAPFDAPWVRMTIISDPQGASFTASQFVPPSKDDVAQGSGAASAA